MTAKPTLESIPRSSAAPAMRAHASRPTLVTSPRLPGDHIDRNPGMPLDLDVVRAIRVNRSAVERRAATIPTRRTVKKEWQAAWLLRAITLIDLTTLSGDDTAGNVRRLCAKARHPVRDDLLRALGATDLGITVGAVCVYHSLVPTAVEALAGTSIRQFRAACGDAHMKAILATGELATLGNVARASMVAMQAGADFIKTSTGKESVNATLPFGVVMCRMIREYFEQTGYAIGFKPAGGIRTAKQSLEFLYLMKEELGDRWLRADLFRFGASSLLTDIERQLEHFVTGRYAAGHRQPMP
jgi:deoxyribose-phosphate aldolase